MSRGRSEGRRKGRTRGRAEQKEATRARLLAVARRLFTEHGYDGTSVGMVCRRSRVTHGALYHHFPGKLELFGEVLREVMAEVAAAVEEQSAGASGRARLERACAAYLDKCADPAVLAIMMRDGPRVLSRERFAEIDRHTYEPLVTGLLRSAIDEGTLQPLQVPLVARVLGGAFEEAGNAIAEATDREQTRRELHALFMRWIDALGSAK